MRDANSLQQVRWAIHYAQADYYLYAAAALKDLYTQQSKKQWRRIDHDGFSKFHSFIDQALRELRACDMLLPAGVDTLSNMGTLFLIRGNQEDLPEARRHLQSAINLNPNQINQNLIRVCRVIRFK